MSRIGFLVMAWAFLPGTALAGTYEAPRDVRKAAKAKFSVKPAASRVSAGVKISFTASAATDVEVAILDSKGKVVRHLAAGLLGKSAPAPLKKGALAQELVWDRRDDCGKPAKGGPFRVRVRLGAQARLEKHVGWGENVTGQVAGLAVGSGGEIYVLGTEFYRGGTDMRVYDKSGKYLRTVIPYSTATPKERTKSVGHLEVNGERLPIVFNGLGKTTHPLTSGMRKQSMAWHPKGYLVMFSALGTMAEHGPPRHLLALHPQGGAPKGVSFVGPRLRKPRGFMGGAGEGSAGCFDHLAVSADGGYVYVSVGAKARLHGKKHSVYRLKWSDAGFGGPWLGKGEAGGDDAHFNDPQGLAVDGKGNVYVCDYGNSRVMIFGKDGKFLGKFAAAKPHQVAVHPKSGEIYVLSCSTYKRWGRLWNEDTAITKFSAWGKDAPRQLAKLERRGMYVMALDASASPPRLWVGGHGVLPIVDKGNALEAGGNIMTKPCLRTLGFIAGDPERKRVLLYLYSTSRPTVMSLDLESGKLSRFCKGTDMALDREGNVYVMGGRDHCFYRYDPKGKPLPFPGTGSHKVKTKGYRGYGPNMGIGGITVDARGNVYVVRNNNYGGAGSYGGRVDMFGPDGKLKKADIVDGLGYGDCGLAVDAAGNIYVGSNLKPKDKPIPAYLAGKAPATSWTWWRGKEREIPWRYTYYNPYLFHWGAVFKFGPEGGIFYGQNARIVRRNKKYGAPRPADDVKNAPPGAEVLRSACLGYEVRAAGHKWRFQGLGIVPSSGDALTPDPGCVCYNGHLAADPYGRVFVPNVFRFSVEMLDTAGNQLARIGRYGNADDGPRKAKPGGPDIYLAWPAFVSARGGKLFIADSLVHCVTVVKFDYAASAECSLP